MIKGDGDDNGAYTYVCMGDKTEDTKDCFETSYEMEEGVNPRIELTGYKVKLDSYKLTYTPRYPEAYWRSNKRPSEAEY